MKKYLRVLACSIITMLISSSAAYYFVVSKNHKTKKSSLNFHLEIGNPGLKRLQAIASIQKDLAAFDPAEVMPAGSSTLVLKKSSRNAFSGIAPNLDLDKEIDFYLGKALFEKLWVSSPSSTQASDGLGPLFNARSCHSCHLYNGRGKPSQNGLSSPSFLLRLYRRKANSKAEEAFLRHDINSSYDVIYGRQLQESAVPGLPAEGRISIEYIEETVSLTGGETVSLRRPYYSINHLAYGKLSSETILSPRLAPPIIGLGLIEAIHENDILALADPEDKDGDGISGRPSLVRDSQGNLRLGRYGWKAEASSVAEQSATALAIDIGISNPLFPNSYGDFTINQPACMKRPTGVQPRLGNTEAPNPILDLISFYTANIAVPARFNASDPSVLAGKYLFHNIGCAACHTPKFTTRRDARTLAHSSQLIWPYSDFLLHDMGEALSDSANKADIVGREWRTPPLWGIGFTKIVNGNTFFMHDGRVRTLIEAVLWHGGEGKKSRDRFALLAPQDRIYLIKFLESL